MAGERIFEYAVICNPTREQAKEGAKAVMVLPPKHIMAVNPDEVTLRAAKEIPEEYEDKLDRLEVAVRPF